ncbi:MAG: ABC transporter permease [Xanthomonadales bacterium]|jgi:predicted permease|nr:ABC transporter permease [Xanthomonadales bacterium]
MSARSMGTEGRWRLDLSAAIRNLQTRRGTLALTVGVLALGVAAFLTLSAVTSAALLQDLPYPNPEALLRVQELHEDGHRPQNVADPNAQDLREQVPAFAGLAQYQFGEASIEADGQVERARVATVSTEFFAVLGAPALLGRTLAAGDTGVVLRESTWRRLFPDATMLSDQQVRISGQWYAVQGVMPERHRFPESAELWVLRDPATLGSSRTALNAAAIARLRPGSTRDQAQAQASAVAKSLAATHSSDIWMHDVALTGLHESLSGGLREPLLATQLAAGLLLLIALANALALQQARISARAEALKLRLLLGAGRGRLLRSLVFEAGLIALVALTLGVGLAVLILQSLPVWAGSLLDQLQARSLAAPVLDAAQFGLIGLLGLLLTLVLSVPAWRWLWRSGRALGPGARVLGTLRSAPLVVGQLALSLLLLLAAALVGQQLWQVLSADRGFDGESVLAVQLAHPPPADAAEAARLALKHQQILDELATLPGVTAVGATNALPLAGGGADGNFLKLRHPDEVPDFDAFVALARDPGRVGSAVFRVVSEGYFDSLSIPLLEGRSFTEADTADGQHVAVISAGLAARSFPGQSPIGQFIQFGNMDGDLRALMVVGVVGDVRDSPGAEPTPSVHVLYRQRPITSAQMEYVLRTRVDPAALTATVGARLRVLAPDAAALVRSLPQLEARALGRQHLLVYLLGGFALTALMLVIAGVHGLVSWQLDQRRGELGLRAAVGARPGQLAGLLLTQGLKLAGWGLALGALAALLLGRWAQSWITGLALGDATLWLISAAVILVGVLAACALPAWQAARMAPLVALRGAS